MANAAARSADLEREPILGFRDLRLEAGVPEPAQGQPVSTTRLDSVRLAVELFNAGRVPLYYRMEAFSLTFAGRTSDTAEVFEYTVSRSPEGFRTNWVTVDQVSK
jgi:hypothetical protein